MPTPRKQTYPQTETATNTVATMICRLRKSRGLTQAELADLIGISRNLLANYELGRTQVTADSLIRIAEALHTSADELLGLKPPSLAASAGYSIRLVRRMEKIALLPQNDQKVILRTIDSFLKGASIESD